MEEKNKFPSRLKFTSEEFVIAWMKAYREEGTVQDIANELDCSKAHIQDTAKKFRRKGVKLPFLKVNGVAVREINVDKLNKLLKKESKNARVE